ncbi:MAG TPA: restriction endonuclease [Patescibacteria group bacterium]|nr:restriction endonuclease [Patescibacteria group bacterium]
MLVRKSDGTTEPFSEEKYYDSIKYSKVPNNFSPTVFKHLKTHLYNGIPTREIYHHTSEFLRNSPYPFTKARYTLKQAIMELGPTGFPFEDYVAKLLERLGYQTLLRQILQGSCVSHEIDVVATKKGKKLMVEAKFHNGLGLKTEIHVSLYTKARFDDIKSRYAFTDSLLITNTKATSEAISYAVCVGMQLIGWSYPNGESLRDLVDKYHLYPVTSFTSLPYHYKQQLLDSNIVLCEDICRNHNLLTPFDIPQKIKETIFQEAAFLCNSTDIH